MALAGREYALEELDGFKTMGQFYNLLYDTRNTQIVYWIFSAFGNRNVRRWICFEAQLEFFGKREQIDRKTIRGTKILGSSVGFSNHRP